MQRELSYKNFTDIAVNMHSEVIVRPFGTHRVLLTADDNIIDLITVYPDEGGDKLVFGLDPAFSYDQYSILIEIEIPAFEVLSFLDDYSQTWPDAHGIDVTIENGFVLAGFVRMDLPPGDTTIDGLTADELAITSDGTTLRGALSVNSLTISAAGGDIALTGTANDLAVTTRVSASDAAVDLAALVVTDALVDLHYGEVVINATGTLSGDVWDAVLKYKDNAGLVANILHDNGSGQIIVVP